MYKRYILICFLFFVIVSAYSQKVKYSNEFLSIGVGAKALGMSNSVIANVNDVTSGFWNPAGLNMITSNIEFTLMHSEYFAGIAKYDYGSIASRIDATSTAGFSFIRFGVDDIPDTSELIDAEGNINYDKVKSFSAADYAFLFSYSKKHKIKGLRYGANVKIIRRKIGDFASAWGFGIDLGGQYDYKKWTLGVMFKDITTTFNAWSYNLSDKMKEVFTITGNTIPKSTVEITRPKILFGINKNFIIYKKFSANTELDLDITTDGKRNVLLKSDLFSIDPHIGAEIIYNNILFVRSGIGNIQSEINIDSKKTTTFQPNIGMGIKLKNIVSLDYAFTDIGDNSIALYSHVFSIKVNINKSKQNITVPAQGF